MNHEESNTRHTYYAALSLIVICFTLWLPNLGRSFWIDETITYWVSKDGLTDAIRRAYLYQANGTIYFLFTWACQSLIGKNEFFLRAINVPFSLTACWLIYRLARIRYGTTCAALTLLFFSASPFVVDATVNYRPYGLVLFFLTLSCYCIGSSLGKPYSSSQIILGGLSFGTALAINMLYIASFVLIGWLFLSQANKMADKRSLYSVLARFTLWALLPLAASFPNFMANIGRAKLITLSNSHSLLESLRQIFMSQAESTMMIVPLGVIFLCIASGKWKNRVASVDAEDLKVIATVVLLYLSIPLSLYFYDHVLGVFAYINRYWFWAVIPEALLLGKLSSLFLRGNEWLFLLPLFVFFQKDRPLDMDFRDASIAIVRMAHEHPECGILIQSGLIESRDSSYFRTEESTAYLFTPLKVYPINLQFIPLSLTFVPPLPSKPCNILLAYPLPVKTSSGEVMTASMMIQKALKQNCRQLTPVEGLELLICNASRSVLGT